MRKSDLIKLVARISLGVMLFHGIAKLKGVSFIEGLLSDLGLPSFFAYGVYIGEILAPLMILIGFRAKIGALLMMGNMLVIILLAHPTDIFKFSKYGGWAIELPALYLFLTIIVYLQGAGRAAVSSQNKWD